jgi:hypothetical protein
LSTPLTTFVRRRLVSAFSVSAFQRFSAAFQVRRYFSSGWAFLIPYLAVYLLYYLRKWPVNAPTGADGASSLELGTWHLVPSLLHVYWALHAINVVVAAVALVQFARSKIHIPKSKFQGTDSEYPQEPAEGAEGVINQDRVVSKKDNDLGHEEAQRDAKTSVPFSVRLRPFSWPGFRPFLLSRFRGFSRSSLPPGKWLGLGVSRFYGFTISRFSGRFQLSAFQDTLERLAPWLLLGLLFYIPGVYLEYPADPWEHYRRINAWQIANTVGEAWPWDKTSYFLAYSLIGRIAPPTRQLFWLDFYYTGCCLLLCWQYYRLARAVGLGKRASMLFVILQSVMFGNNIFGFYRYYAISSSIFAQLGAVALTRVAIEYASQKFQVPRTKDQGARAKEQVTSTKEQGASSKETFSAFARLCAPLRLKRFGQPAPPLSSLPPVKSSHELAEGAEQRTNDLTTESQSYRASDGKIRDRSIKGPTSSTLLTPLPPVKWFGLFPSRFPLSAFASAAVAALALLALIAFNHQQGLGIAGLGLLGVAVWRLIEWKRSMIWWLTATALVLSVVAIRWFPRDPAIDQIYRPGGWLTSWYGFNLFAFNLPVGDRMLQIVGTFGLANLVAAVLLLRRNSLVGWLTITPLIALSLPFIAIPLADSIVRHGDVSEIITYQRMLFAIPPSLALIALLEGKFQVTRTKDRVPRSKYQVPSSKFQGNPVELLQDETEGTEDDSHHKGTESTEKATSTKAAAPFFARLCAALWLKKLPQSSAPLSPLPPVKSSQEIAELEDKFRVPRTKSQGTGAEVLQEVTERTENGVVEPETPTAHGDIARRSTGSEPSACRMKEQTPTGAVLQETAKSAEGSEQRDEDVASPSPLSPLAPVKWLGLRFLRFTGFAPSRIPAAFGFSVFQLSAFSVLLLSITALLLVSANGPNYNRFWQALMIPPDDLTMKPVVSALDSSQTRIHAVTQQTVATPHAVAVALVAISPKAFPYSDRTIGQPIADPLNSVIATALLGHKTITLKDRALIDWYARVHIDQFFVLMAPPTQILWSSASLAAQLSRHWPAQEVATNLAGNLELAALARPAAGSPSKSSGMIIEIDEFTKPSGASK